MLVGGLLACGDDATGPVPPEDLPFPTEVEEDGLLFGLYSLTAGDEWVLGAWVKNVSDTAIERRFPGGCMVGDVVAYRERDFGEPVWRLDEVPGFACFTNAITVSMRPGQERFPDDWRLDFNTSKELVLGDCLPSRLYRFGADLVDVSGTMDGDGPSASLIAPNPVRLEASR